MLIYRYRTILHAQRQKSDYGKTSGATREYWVYRAISESKETLRENTKN